MKKLTIERITRDEQVDWYLLDFAYHAGHDLNARFGFKYNWTSFNLLEFAQKHRVMVCRNDKEIVGVMLSVIGKSVFDPDVKICRQVLLHTTNAKATYLLMKDFIDFGKRNADHIITMLTPNTNLKPKSLEKLGFKQIETAYRMET